MKSPEILPLSVLKQRAMAGRIEAVVHGQVETLVKKETRDGKPFWELVLADAEGKITLRAWSDAPAFAACEEMAVGTFLEVTGEFAHNGGFGLDAKRWNCRELTTEERDTLLAGSPELREKQAADYAFIEQTAGAMADPRLKELAAIFLSEYGARFRRAASGV